MKLKLPRPSGDIADRDSVSTDIIQADSDKPIIRRFGSTKFGR